MNDLQHCLVSTWKVSESPVNSNYLPQNDVLEGYKHDKKLLRQRALTIRNNTFNNNSSSINAELTAGLITQSLRILEKHQASRLCAYSPHGAEPGNFDWLDAISSQGRQLFLPLSKEGGILEWGKYEGAAAMVPGRYRIPEPASSTPQLFTSAPGVDVMFIPATAVDKHGGRLGRGAGFYDRTLARLRAQLQAGELLRMPLLVGVVYDHEVLDNIPLEDHDERLDMVVTPTQIYFCTNSDA